MGVRRTIAVDELLRSSRRYLIRSRSFAGGGWVYADVGSTRAGHEWTRDPFLGTPLETEHLAHIVRERLQQRFPSLEMEIWPVVVSIAEAD